MPRVLGEDDVCPGLDGCGEHVAVAGIVLHISDAMFVSFDHCRRKMVTHQLGGTLYSHGIQVGATLLKCADHVAKDSLRPCGTEHTFERDTQKCVAQSGGPDDVAIEYDYYYYSRHALRLLVDTQCLRVARHLG